MTNTPALSDAPSTLDSVVYFYETVFTAQANETPEHAAEIKKIIETSFAAGYTFDGQPQSPDGLVAWRLSLLQRFTQMVFRVDNVLSGPVSVAPPAVGSGLAMSWHVDAVDTAGKQWRLDGMSLLMCEGGKAASNNQLGDAGNGWHEVPPT